MKLLPGIYQVGGPARSHSYDATAYLLTAGDDLYMIDCGKPEGFPLIIGNIRSLGFDPSRIRAVFATHGHYDHCGAARLFREQFGTTPTEFRAGKVGLPQYHSTSLDALPAIQAVPSLRAQI